MNFLLFFSSVLGDRLSEWTYRAVTSSPCEVYRLTSCDIGRGVCECNDLALGDSCDNEGCAREKSFAKHCDCCVVELMREGNGRY